MEEERVAGIAMYANNSSIYVAGYIHYENDSELLLWKVSLASIKHYSIEKASRIEVRDLITCITMNNKYIVVGTDMNVAFIYNFNLKEIKKIEPECGINALSTYRTPQRENYIIISNEKDVRVFDVEKAQRTQFWPAQFVILSSHYIDHKLRIVGRQGLDFVIWSLGDEPVTITREHDWKFHGVSKLGNIFLELETRCEVFDINGSLIRERDIGNSDNNCGGAGHLMDNGTLIFAGTKYYELAIAVPDGEQGFKRWGDQLGFNFQAEPDDRDDYHIISCIGSHGDYVSLRVPDGIIVVELQAIRKASTMDELKKLLKVYEIDGPYDPSDESDGPYDPSDEDQY